VEDYPGRYPEPTRVLVRTMAPIVRTCPHLQGGEWCSLIKTNCSSVEACVYKLTAPLEEPVSACASRMPPMARRGDRGILGLIGRRLAS